MKTIKDKIKSFSFWTGLSAAVVVLFQSLGKVFGFSVNEQGISDIIMAICGVLVVFGIVSKKENKIQDKTEDLEQNLNDNKAKINENNQ